MVKGRTRLGLNTVGYCWLCFKVCLATIGELSALGVIKFHTEIFERTLHWRLYWLEGKNHSYSIKIIQND